ncbi:ATP-binding cassette domain-containing protein [Oceanobacillus piezotolerans]|uniref:ATP-binding cassette domain-containing protein n=1 Tax=Oceanobacillus piezotolerans TaxID=2448030 RepID=A0A498D2W4_9BACI|nr:LytTR family transcriptional regulator DNA-binding domain-containing protein [Oceanobacillus piezotolerans]RLL42023.1 ATP-binding cassette domain-containing protein [Oceanobacillus piezotolerans]
MVLLAINNVEKHDKDNVLFPCFSLKVEKGEVAAIHSTLNIRKTLIDMISGDHALTSGELIINGKTLKDKKDYFKQLGLCLFEEGLYERLTAKEYISFYRSLYGFKQTFDYILQLTQLEQKKNMRIKHFSSSEKRRVQFARVLAIEPSFYVFEEPDLNVDLETRRIFISILEHIQKQGRGALILTGNMESALTFTNHVFRLDENGLRKVETEPEEKVMEEAEPKREVKTAQFHKIPTKVNEKIVLFEPTEIDYIESNDGQSFIYTKGEMFPSTLTLNQLEDRLHPFGFFRCHRSYIVNLQKVREVITWTRNSFSLILDDKNKSSIPLSKSKMAVLKELLGMK